MSKAVSAWLLLGCIAAVSACGDTSPATPTPSPTPTVDGTWTGTLAVQDVSGRMTWTLTQTGSTVAGPVLVSLPSGTVLLNGFLTGTISGPSLIYTITVGLGGVPSQPSCAGQMTGTMAVTIAATSTLSGPMAFSSGNCLPPFASSTITLTRQ